MVEEDAMGRVPSMVRRGEEGEERSRSDVGREKGTEAGRVELLWAAMEEREENEEGAPEGGKLED